MSKTSIMTQAQNAGLSRSKDESRPSPDNAGEPFPSNGKIQEEKHTEYFSSLSDYSTTPLWANMDKMVPPKPNPRAAPTQWQYSKMRPLLTKAAEIVTAEEAERRVLVLVNKNMTAPYTTDSIYAGLQIVLPGEVAPAHRHRAFALRFIIEGEGGYTAVEGEKVLMQRGDVILTPSWHWHDHGNEGTDAVIWLDGLDLPLWQFLPINMLEHYEESRYPSEVSDSSKFRFPWSEAQSILDSHNGPYAIHHYRTQSGEHLSKTISAQAERLAAGASSLMSREIMSYVYHIVDGHGYSTIGSAGNEPGTKIEWTTGDTFAVPAHSTVSHTCTMTQGQAYLFAINDQPMVEALTTVKLE